MAYCKNDDEAAALVAQTLGSYPDTCWDNVDRLVRRALSQIGYRPVKTKPVVLKVVEILKQQGKFNEWGDPNMILDEASKHREIMDKHFKRAREFLYGFPTATQGDKCDKDDVGSTTTVMPSTDVDVAEEEFVDSVADEPIAEEAPMGMSDEVAAKKIARKLMGTPDLTFQKIQQMVPQYLSMVGKASTDAKHLSVLVFDELQDMELAEEQAAHGNVDPDMMGLSAFRNGVPLSQCPYDADFDTDAYAAWVRGWRAGATEADSITSDSMYEADDDSLSDQDYLDKREADYMADAGTNLVKGEYVKYGHKFETYVFDDIDVANEFMRENSGWGAIGDDAEGKYHIARLDDEGTPVGQMEESMLDEGDADAGREYYLDDTTQEDAFFGVFDAVRDGHVDMPDVLDTDMDSYESMSHYATSILATIHMAGGDTFDEQEWSAYVFSKDGQFFILFDQDFNDGPWVESLSATSEGELFALLDKANDAVPVDEDGEDEDEDEDEVDEAQEAVIQIPRDQDKSFKDEVLVGGTDGPEQDMNYIKRLKALAGLK